jgi:UDP-N-acetylglucosamine--N-acetylmuramyl-(pentapeptide) pyrophosphoryl-undecaprenol N-acetylglucosamine transferase
MKEAKRLLVAGGGTGGHILAGIAIADEWKKQVGDGAEVLFVGAEQGLEARLVPKYGYRLKVLKIGALNRVTLKRKVLTLFQLPFSFLKTLFILLSYRPDAVIGVGGYSSGPVVLLARSIGGLWGVRTAIIEQNSVAGFTNRMLGKRVHRVFCAFQAATQLFNPKKVLVTGNPIRSSLKRLPSSVGIPFTLFIFGGSQGAAGINTLILDALPFLKGMEIDFIHQTGVYDYERVVKGYERCYEKASLVVCRAGASSMSELASVGRAAIFIPLPTAADNHQEKNARIFEHADAAVVVPQGSMTGAEFAQKIIYLKTNSDVIHAIEAKVAKFYHSDAAFQIVKDLRT